MQTNEFFYSCEAGGQVACHHFQRCLGFDFSSALVSQVFPGGWVAQLRG